MLCDGTIYAVVGLAVAIGFPERQALSTTTYTRKAAPMTKKIVLFTLDVPLR